MSRRAPDQPIPIRQPLSRYEEGAHLWARPVAHLKGGVVALVPLLILFFTTQPLDQAVTAIAIGGYTVLPGIVLVSATAWMAMSIPLLHTLRYRDHVRVHLVTYGAAGAVALTVLAIVVGIYGPDLWAALLPDYIVVRDEGALVRNALIAPAVGAAGAALGRWSMNRDVMWHRMIVREPLPDVFTFVDKKFDKNDFTEK